MKTRIDRTNEMLAFIESKATSERNLTDTDGCGHPERIFLVPKEYEDEIARKFQNYLYDPDFGLGDRFDFSSVCAGLFKMPSGPQSGPYHYRKRGCDFDGFYESGASGDIQCDSYVTFWKVYVTNVKDPWDAHPRRYVSRDSYADGSPCCTYIICFV